MIASVGLFVATLALQNCGGSSTQSQQSSTPSSTTASVTTTITDPPTCAAPTGGFNHVWVTITRVRANISANAGPNDSGWMDMLDLSQSPKQIDLLSLTSNTCLLTQLGTNTGLPPGNYQQIRLLLLANDASGVATPSPNQCGSNGFNCVVLVNGATQTIQLSSEAQTGIKIPPGQISTGGINLTAGQSSDLNIDFNACDSILEEGNGRFRLKPTLHAGEVSLNSNSISGRVVDSVTKKPIAMAKVLVEQPDANGTDRVLAEEMAAADGTFIFCPLPSGDYDVVAAGFIAPVLGPAALYNATVTFKVPVGAALGDIPLVPESGASTNIVPATIHGQVTSSGTGNTATAADITLSALQQATPTGGPSIMVSVPLFPGSTPTVATAAASTCPTNTDCVNYSLLVPASNPSVGTFSSSGTNYSVPVSGNVQYGIDADSFTPDGSNTPDCSPSDVTTSLDVGGGPLTVALGVTVTAKTLIFTGCQ